MIIPPLRRRKGGSVLLRGRTNLAEAWHNIPEREKLGEQRMSLDDLLPNGNISSVSDFGALVRSHRLKQGISDLATDLRCHWASFTHRLNRRLLSWIRTSAVSSMSIPARFPGSNAVGIFRSENALVGKQRQSDGAGKPDCRDFWSAHFESFALKIKTLRIK